MKQSTVISRLAGVRGAERQCGLVLAGALCLGLAAIEAVAQSTPPPSSTTNSGSTNERFYNFVFATCQLGPPIDPSSSLGRMCDNAISGSLAGGTFIPGLVSVNAGTGGAQGGASNVSAAQQRAALEGRLEGEGEVGKKGGGASADFKFGPIGVSMSLQGGRAHRKVTPLENGFGADLKGVLGTVDYRFSDSLVTGVSLGYTKSDAKYDAAGGTLDSRSTTVSLFTNYVPNQNAYLGGYVGYGAISQDGTRRVLFGAIDGTSASSTDGNQFLAAVSGGYNWYKGDWTLGGFFSASYAKTDTDGYAEAGNTGLELLYPDQTVSSLPLILGGRVSYRQAYGWGAVSPQVRLAYVHEFMNNSRNIATQLVVNPGSFFTMTTDSPDRNYFLGGLGATVEAGRGTLLFVDFEQRFGDRYLDAWAVGAGFLTEF